jgi:hypothetical protein
VSEKEVQVCKMVVVAVMEWFRMTAFEIETIAEFQKMAIPNIITVVLEFAMAPLFMLI